MRPPSAAAWRRAAAATLGVEHPGEAFRPLVRAWRAFHDQLVAEWLRGRTFPEADLLRLLCGSLADLMEGARALERENIALVDWPYSAAKLGEIVMSHHPDQADGGAGIVNRRADIFRGTIGSVSSRT
jgi:hypothetical protein